MKKTQRNLSTRIHHLIKNNWGMILLLLSIMTIRSSFADWYTVPSGSMLPTIEIGDRVTVNKMAYDFRLPFTDTVLANLSDPERGDIVIIASQAADERLLKRVIGLPGDTVAMQDEQLIINSQPLRYQVIKDSAQALYLNEQLGTLWHQIRIDKTKESAYGNLATITIPPDHYLVMGDNRRNSADSRLYGLVPRSELQAKATAVAFSLDYDNYYLPKQARFLKGLY